jgi:phosphoribosylglycinamide formyltransferase-1
MRLAFLVSRKGTGSSLSAALKNRFNIKLVMADSKDASGIKIAKIHKIHTRVMPYVVPQDITKGVFRDRYSKKIGELLKNRKIDLTILAGFNRVLTGSYFKIYKGLTINIHPGAIPDEKKKPFQFADGSDAPWNQGMMTEKAVANFLPLRFATSTIHIVTQETDLGPVLKRVFVTVKPQDTVDTLYARLKVAENEGLIEILKKLQ